MEKKDVAYEIKISLIISYESFNHVRKVEAVQTKTITFFRYTSVTTYRDYDVIEDEKFFLDKEEALAYWNQEISAQYTVMAPSPAMCISA